MDVAPLIASFRMILIVRLYASLSAPDFTKLINLCRFLKA